MSTWLLQRPPVWPEHLRLQALSRRTPVPWRWSRQRTCLLRGLLLSTWHDPRSLSMPKRDVRWPPERPQRCLRMPDLSSWSLLWCSNRYSNSSSCRILPAESRNRRCRSSLCVPTQIPLPKPRYGELQRISLHARILLPSSKHQSQPRALSCWYLFRPI